MEDGKGGAMVVSWRNLITKMGIEGGREKERERGVLQASGRVESPDSKRDLHIRFCNSVLHTSKA